MIKLCIINDSNMLSFIVGFFSSVSVVLLLGLVSKMRLYSKLRFFNGRFFELNVYGHVDTNKRYDIEYSFLDNLFTINESFKIKKVSEQTWSGYYYVYSNNPYIMQGIYKYDLNSKWGYQNVYLNPYDLKIFVEAYFDPNGISKTFKYTLLKVE